MSSSETKKRPKKGDPLLKVQQEIRAKERTAGARVVIESGLPIEKSSQISEKEATGINEGFKNLLFLIIYLQNYKELRAELGVRALSNIGSSISRPRGRGGGREKERARRGDS